MSTIQTNVPPDVSPRKGRKFWLIMMSICIANFLASLEVTAVSTALPTIAHDLHATQFIWVGSAYVLAATAFLPMSGGLAQIFGRRPTLLFSLGAFFLGSGICGGAKNMPMLIAGRTVQGIGGGGIQSLSVIVLADIVTLTERGAYSSFLALAWAVASFIGPVLGGSLATQGQWRWLFYLNLPITGLTAGLVFVLLDLPTPPGNIVKKLAKLDWIGNFMVIASTTSCTIALSWGGVVAPWTSARTLVPLFVGLFGFGAFILYEAKWASHPLVPFSVLSNRTSVSGYLQTFFVAAAGYAELYMFPVYFQACKDASAVRSGVYGIAMAILAPAAFTAGVLVKKTGRYRPQMFVGWAFMLVGFGLLSTVHANSNVGLPVGYVIILGVGAGIEYTCTLYPVQAPLPISSNAHALAFMMFVKSFAAVWGITIGGTVVDNQLRTRLPATFTSLFPGSVDLAYSIIPLIPSMEQPLKGQVQVAFADSLIVVWQVLIGISEMGMLSALLMKGLPLHGAVDKEWTLKEKEGKEMLNRSDDGGSGSGSVVELGEREVSVA